MNDEELKKLWQEQPLRNPPSATQFVLAMQKQTTEFRRILLARDIRELVVCGILLVVFGFYAYFERTPIVRLGWLIIIGGTVFIAFKLLHARHTTPPAPPGATTVQALRAELNSVRTQSRLLGSVLWWYLLPLGIGLLVATWGMPIHFLVKIPVSLFYVALYWYIYWLNQRARAQKLVPLEAQLQSLLHSAETGAPLDEAEVTNLRPIVLSMAAADHVKPVEFKVAFWQIAIFGEIGFIGIWFFLMIGLATGNKSAKTSDQPPKTPTTNVRTEITNRYSIVAQKVVDLVNAGDYAGVQRLYNEDMSKAFPLKETIDFHARLAERHGRIETLESTTNGYSGWPAFRLHCQDGEMVMSLALDANDKIDGIYFQPGARRPVSFKSIVVQLFSPLHLLWLVLFFLAGLLYSRILQKMTERAVGISAIGIHLNKGQSLILWDEIKEIRPFKLLHVRSLWLIRESGEKTIMPWTSLERHPELKAAVENSAPTKHPIRQYLSLL